MFLDFFLSKSFHFEHKDSISGKGFFPLVDADGYVSIFVAS
jgi:hypothetical protein